MWRPMITQSLKREEEVPMQNKKPVADGNHLILPTILCMFAITDNGNQGRKITTRTAAKAEVVFLGYDYLRESVPLQVSFEFRVFTWLPPQDNRVHSAVLINTQPKKNGFVYFLMALLRREGYLQEKEMNPLFTPKTITLLASLKSYSDRYQDFKRKNFRRLKRTFIIHVIVFRKVKRMLS